MPSPSWLVLIRGSRRRCLYVHARGCDQDSERHGHAAPLTGTASHCRAHRRRLSLLTDDAQAVGEGRARMTTTPAACLRPTGLANEKGLTFGLWPWLCLWHGSRHPTCNQNRRSVRPIARPSRKSGPDRVRTQLDLERTRYCCSLKLISSRRSDAILITVQVHESSDYTAQSCRHIPADYTALPLAWGDTRTRLGSCTVYTAPTG